MHNEEHKMGSIKLPISFSIIGIQNLKKYYFLFIAILLFSLSSKSTNTTQNLENQSHNQKLHQNLLIYNYHQIY